jgi:thymus-specific serine protease
VTNYSLTSDNKWVSFGGSYPGMMSGFFRLKYPNLVHASVSSSSPWNAILDMQQYQNVVGNSLAVTSVGGSDTCKQIVVDGHNTIADMITTSEGRATLASVFNFCEPDALSTQLIAGEWAGSGVIEVPSQENDPSCTTPGCDIGSICEILSQTPANSTDDLDENVARLAAVSSAQNSGHCVAGWTEVTMEATLHEAFLDIYSSERSWPYQTCTEFGFYQV